MLTSETGPGYIYIYTHTIVCDTGYTTQLALFHRIMKLTLYFGLSRSVITLFTESVVLLCLEMNWRYFVIKIICMYYVRKKL